MDLFSSGYPYDFHTTCIASGVLEQMIYELQEKLFRLLTFFAIRGCVRLSHLAFFVRRI